MQNPGLSAPVNSVNAIPDALVLTLPASSRALTCRSRFAGRFAQSPYNQRPGAIDHALQSSIVTLQILAAVS